MQVRPRSTRRIFWTRRAQPRITAGALLHGNVSRKIPIGAAGWVWNRIAVTMPKLPPPPPRLAQNSGRFVVGVDMADLAVGSDHREAGELVAGQPVWRLATPSPPPSVSPAAPTVGQVPVGIVRPEAASRLCTR